MPISDDDRKISVEIFNQLIDKINENDLTNYCLECLYEKPPEEIFELGVLFGYLFMKNKESAIEDFIVELVNKFNIDVFDDIFDD